MRIPQLKTCCCGCTLESGSLIIGWLDLIGGLILTSTAIFTAASHEGSLISVGGLGSTILLIINGILTIILSVCLILGVNKRSHKLIRSWVILSAIMVLFYFFSGMVNMIMIMVQGYIGTALTSCIAVLFSVALSSYLICVVHSLYREILAEVQPSVA